MLACNSASTARGAVSCSCMRRLTRKSQLARFTRWTCARVCALNAVNDRRSFAVTSSDDDSKQSTPGAAKVCSTCPFLPREVADGGGVPRETSDGPLGLEGRLPHSDGVSGRGEERGAIRDEAGAEGRLEQAERRERVLSWRLRQAQGKARVPPKARYPVRRKGRR